ncbi:sensor histidine kinase [Microbacterium xylanilyticum]
MTPFRLPPVAGTTPWSAGINLAGALAVLYGLWRGAPHFAPWVLAVTAAGLVAWVARTMLAVRQGALPRQGALESEAPDAGAHPAAHPAPQNAAVRVIGALLLALMLLGGGLTAVPTQGLGTALLVVAVIVVTSDPANSPVVWGAAALAAGLAIAAGAALTIAGLAGAGGVNVLGVLAVIAGLVLAVVVGLGRRAQRVLAAERERANAEAVRAQATAHRVAIARDLHDVLAHSLGGLVVQLDAAEALLEAGETERAAARVTAARRLAVEGLDEAREAVRALRGPEQDEPGPAATIPGAAAGTAATVDPSALSARIAGLLPGHDTATVQVEERGEPRAVSAALAEALVRAVQEGLSNARKHAPAAEVRIRLVWHPDRVECTIENGLRASGGELPGNEGESRGALAATGGGFGLRGVRERFAAVGGTATAGTIRTGKAELFRLRVEAPA